MHHKSDCRFYVKPPKPSQAVRDGELLEAYGMGLYPYRSLVGAARIPEANLGAIDPVKIRECLAAVDEAMPSLRRFQRRLRAATRVTVTDGARCRHCDGPMPSGSGSGRLYCSRSCRQRAYEARRP